MSHGNNDNALDDTFTLRGGITNPVYFHPCIRVNRYISRRIPRRSNRRRERSILFATSTFALTALAATALFFVQALLWSGLYLHFDAINSIEYALSFSIGVFTTYGNSGVVLGRPWVLLSEIQAVNGVMAFGITTAFLFNLAKRLQPRN